MYMVTYFYVTHTQETKCVETAQMLELADII